MFKGLNALTQKLYKQTHRQTSGLDVQIERLIDKLDKKLLIFKYAKAHLTMLCSDPYVKLQLLPEKQHKVKIFKTNIFGFRFQPESTGENPSGSAHLAPRLRRGLHLLRSSLQPTPGSTHHPHPDSCHIGKIVDIRR